MGRMLKYMTLTCLIVQWLRIDPMINKLLPGQAETLPHEEREEPGEVSVLEETSTATRLQFSPAVAFTSKFEAEEGAQDDASSALNVEDAKEVLGGLQGSDLIDRQKAISAQLEEMRERQLNHLRASRAREAAASQGSIEVQSGTSSVRLTPRVPPVR
ncbi:hypothetical protein CYMTET_45683 [Cymbomonas tetramitiformis]|uniref:Uncharacterized protein n=1 Tax=Cymbomonas tetramitiformis TaxID=36881 RepID=A0AAE0EY32_9CHLO|nr:hypothetical protein CYMTET_45684 [Cymbomonas tetramitiformis]KAK3244718.1 hypothetical protein CYMTET_45683 [Cymbomonas tetramitiformis]